MAKGQNYKHIKDKGFNVNPQNINKDGRPRDILTRLLRQKLEDEKDKIRVTGVRVDQDEKGKWINTGEKVTIEINIPTREVIITALLYKAGKGDLKAAEIIFDRMEGKPKQESDVNLKVIDLPRNVIIKSE